MLNQLVNIVEFPTLYKILFEIKNLYIFKIINYEKSKDFINQVKLNKSEQSNSIIIVEKKNYELFVNNKIDKNNILFFDELPIKIEKILDKINTLLIKKKYNTQSKLSIKHYTLNLNSRTITTKDTTLKLTEREIDIILFLNDQKTPQSVSRLQDEVWGYSFDLETHTVETHIYRLRKKIKNKFNDKDFIISHDEGYLI